MKENTKNVLAVLSAAFMSFVGILTETSLNVTFPTMMKQFGVGLDIFNGRQQDIYWRLRLL